MRTLFKIAVLLLAAHAMFRFVPPYWHHNQFETELKDVSQQWGEPHDQQVVQHVLTTAAKHQVPITSEHVTVRRVAQHILVEVAYSVPIEWVPTVVKPWTFETKLDVWRLEPPKIPGR